MCENKNQLDNLYYLSKKKLGPELKMIKKKKRGDKKKMSDEKKMGDEKKMCVKKKKPEKRKDLDLRRHILIKHLYKNLRHERRKQIKKMGKELELLLADVPEESDAC